jgi:uracil-DNA glycosylase family 4
MTNSLDKNSREKLDVWLRYYADLNLGEFYKDRVPMAKRSANSQTVKVSAPPSPPVAAVPAANPAAAALPVLHAASQMESLNRIDAQTLDAVRAHLGECTRCRLHKQRNKIVFGTGNPQARLVFVGEGPGHDEDVQGLPFVGRAGKLLTQMIEAMGLQRQDVYICNVVKCRPPENRKPEDDEVATCSPYLYRQLELIAPKAIVCLGGVAAQTLLKTKDPISRFRGTWFDFQNTKLLPTYHPAYLLRNPNAKGEVWKDLQKVMAYLELTPKKTARA